MIPFSIIIDEYEQGAWIADLVSIEQCDGSFDFAGETWSGTVVSHRLEFERHYTKVIGGKGKLAKPIANKYYSGNVSLQVAVQDVCREAGETFGSATPGKFLSTFARINGNAAYALDIIAEAFGMIWWVDRSGATNMAAARTADAKAEGSRISSDNDSALLIEPENLTIGATYGEESETVRHIRWAQDSEKFEARIYFVPFIFRPPTERRYDALRQAMVERQNSDNTVDVKAADLGVSQAPLLCGIPGGKIKVNAGELVALGFFGGDPQKPFVLAMAQDSSATKQVARKGDSVTVTIDTPALALLAPFMNSPAGPCVGLPGSVDVSGTITSGSERLKVGD